MSQLLFVDITFVCDHDRIFRSGTRCRSRIGERDSENRYRTILTNSTSCDLLQLMKRKEGTWQIRRGIDLHRIAELGINWAIL
jgi:hypothetical protein